MKATKDMVEKFVLWRRIYFTPFGGKITLSLEESEVLKISREGRVKMDYGTGGSWFNEGEIEILEVLE